VSGSNCLSLSEPWKLITYTSSLRVTTTLPVPTPPSASRAFWTSLAAAFHCSAPVVCRTKIVAAAGGIPGVVALPVSVSALVAVVRKPLS